MTEINDLSVPIAVPERPLDYMTHILAVADAEVRKLRHDPWDMFGRAVQPVLWLVLFGEVMARVRGIASDGMLSHNTYAAVAEGNCVPQSFDLRGGRLRAMMIKGAPSTFGLNIDFLILAAVFALLVVIAARIYPRMAQ